MSNTSTLGGQSVEVIAMPRRCIGARCNELWCKRDKLSLQQEFSSKWSSKYLENKKKQRLVTGCIEASMKKKAFCFFVLKIYDPKTLYVLNGTSKRRKTKQRSSSCSVEIFGSLGTLNRCISLPVPDSSETLGATARVSASPCESLFYRVPVVRSSRKAARNVQSTAWNEGKGHDWNKEGVTLAGKVHLCWLLKALRTFQHVNGNLHACKWGLLMCSFVFFCFFLRFLISGANMVGTKSPEPMFSFSPTGRWMRLRQQVSFHRWVWIFWRESCRWDTPPALRLNGLW